MFKNKRIYSLILTIFMIVGVFIIPTRSHANGENVKITILGTTDLHAHIYNWSYEDGKELDDIGMAKVYSVVKEARQANPNTILIDNGDTIQGTILADDLYNTIRDLPNPVIDVMNFMKYDAMTLGNHEFNFGLDLVGKIEKEANFPLLSANTKYKKDDSYLVEPYTIVEVDGIKVGIVGLTTPNIPKWDGPKVMDLKFENMADAAEESIRNLKEKENVDLIIATAHSNYEEDYGNDAAKEIIERNPEIAALLVGHSHATINEKLGNIVVGGARDAGREVVKFELSMKKDGDSWIVDNSTVDIIEVKEYEASKELKEYALEYHEKTIDFIKEVIGTATEDFHPKSQVLGIPEAQIKDTAVIDLINKVQLEATGADIAAAALFQPASNLSGDITYANIFDVYKYPNTLVGIELSGKELKDYMEWSAAYYNTFKPGDVNISFNPDIRGYNYDMFQGVDYKVDISKPVGKRIVDLKYKGEFVKETDIVKVAINNYRYGGLKNMGIISGEPYFESDPKSLRSYIADYIKEEGEISPVVDNNWEVIGADLDHPLKDYILGQVNKGNIEIPKSQDGRSYNAKALNAFEMIKEGLIPEEVLNSYGIIAEKQVKSEVKPNIKLEVRPDIKPETKLEIKLRPAVKKYVVKPNDVLWKIAKMFKTTWENLAEINGLKNPHLIFPNQELLVPEQ